MYPAIKASIFLPPPFINKRIVYYSVRLSSLVKSCHCAVFLLCLTLCNKSDGAFVIGLTRGGWRGEAGQDEGSS